ncbi:hypothetical protein BGZ65_001707 [Modicella reniformis]|uniref:Uncharacterized protein n=1 Tax=Modicella reniformis TaxID=1440133 RepID=A0A9P6MLN6_9FUNG|nr:hypothetical protein BGZ65_001707 [Modicella reniformis]
MAPPAPPTPTQQTIRVYNDRSRPPINIVSRFDTRTERQIVLWKDVQTIFKNAQYIRRGEQALSFLVDDNFDELKPRRIEAYPGEVLEVVLESTNPVNSSTSTSDSAFNQPETTPAPATQQPLNDSDRGAPSQPPSSNSGDARAADSRRASLRSRESFSERDARQGQHSRGSNNPVSQNDSEGSASPKSSEAFAQLRRPQAFVNTAAVPRIQGYLTQVKSLEWHEAPAPRLFIVLPRTFVEELTPNYSSYRLFWMCEYTNESSIAPHLDSHPGLDLDRPAEFFAKFGPHLLLNFQVFQYSRFNRFHEDGLKYLPDDDPHPGFDEAIWFLQNTLDMAKGEVELSLDIMIDHVRTIVDGLPEIERGSKSVGSYYSETWETENLPQLTPQNFTQLRSFLFKPGMRKSSSEEVHGLYRSTDVEGHVHWLCHSHLEHVHPFIKFGQTFMRNHGTPQYNTHAGQIIAEKGTPLAARLLYGILLSSPGFVSELIFHIGWEMTVEDLGHLRDVILRCRIVSLVLKGSDNHLTLPVHSQLISPTLAFSHIQSFTLENAQDVLKHVNPLSLTSSFTNLRTLRLTLKTNGQDLNAIRIRLLLVILNSPNLKILEVEWIEMEMVFTKEAFIWELAKRGFKNLSVHLKIQDQELSVLIDISQVRNVHLKISDLMSAGSNPHIYYGNVQTLTVKKCASILDPDTEAILERILSACTSLVTLTLTCNAIDFSPAERTVRKLVKDLSPACALERLILKEAAQNNITATFSLKGNQNDPMWNHQCRPMQVDVTVLDHHPGLELILINYATVIRTLNTTHRLGPRQLTFLSKVILQEESAQLESLLIALDDGQWRGYECIEQILEGCSSTLRQLTFVGSPGNSGDEALVLKTLALYKGRQLIIAPDRQLSIEGNIQAQHGRIASNGQPSSLPPSSSSEETRREWIEKVKRTISSDTVLVIVEDFEALCDIVPGVTADNISWLKKREK